MVEVAGSEMIAVQNVPDAVDGDDVVAGVAANLQPGLEVVAERTHSAGEVGGSSAAIKSSEPVAGIELQQQTLVHAVNRAVPTGADARAAGRPRLNSFRLTICTASGTRVRNRRRRGSTNRTSRYR